MLTAEEKRVIAERIGWKSRALGGGTFYYRTLHLDFDIDIEFSLDDAGLVRDWLVDKDMWEAFEAKASLDYCKKYEANTLFITSWALHGRFVSWLFATENGEAVNFFRSFVKWCEEGK